MAMKISLIHPSRGRAKKSFQNSMEWLIRSGINSIELILSIDVGDNQVHDYMHEYECARPVYPINTIVYNNNSVVEATNKAAHQSTGDILIYLSDDFKCPDNWGAPVLKEFEGEDRPLLVKVDDCLQKFDVPVLTIPIMNRALYERLGYFFHPEYKSMFCDEDLYWTARKLGALKFAPHLKFPHEHVSIGKAQDDETYRNSAKNWDQGKAMFAKRKAAGFPV